MFVKDELCHNGHSLTFFRRGCFVELVLLDPFDCMRTENWGPKIECKVLFSGPQKTTLMEGSIAADLSRSVLGPIGHD